MIIDPKPPLRRDLEIMCGGNQRLVKAFEQLFKLIPNQLNIGDDAINAAQLSADQASSQANSAQDQISNIKTLALMVVLQPSIAINCSDSLGLMPRFEKVFVDDVSPSTQGTECLNFNLEVT